VELFRHLLGKVVRLAPILVRVVKFPNVVVEGYGLSAYEHPWRPVLCHRGPALVIDAAVAEHLEVLRLMPLRGLGVIERIQHAHALDWALLYAIDRNRFGQPCRLENRGRDIDDMVELRADFALRFNAIRPRYDGAVTRPAPVRSDLLRPPVRRVHRVRPADRIVVI